MSEYLDGEPAHSLDQVLGGNVRRIRTGLGWTQGDLVEAMVGAGLKWKPTTVTWIETGRRKITGAEVFELCRVLGVTPTELIAGEGWYGPKWQARKLATLRDAISRPRLVRRADPTGAADRDEDRKLAKKLAVPVSILRMVAADRYGRPLGVERDARLGDTEGMTPRTIQAKRGQIARSIYEELKPVMDGYQEGPEGEQHRRRVDVISDLVSARFA